MPWRGMAKGKGALQLLGATSRHPSLHGSRPSGSWQPSPTATRRSHRRQAPPCSWRRPCWGPAGQKPRPPSCDAWGPLRSQWLQRRRGAEGLRQLRGGRCCPGAAREQRRGRGLAAGAVARRPAAARPPGVQGPSCLGGCSCCLPPHRLPRGGHGSGRYSGHRLLALGLGSAGRRWPAAPTPPCTATSSGSTTAGARLPSAASCMPAFPSAHSYR